MKVFIVAVVVMIAVTVLAVKFDTPSADILFGSTVIPHEGLILQCYNHFSWDAHVALGNLLAAEKSHPPILDDGEKFAARIREICHVDPLSEDCLTSKGRMQTCISAIAID